MSKKDVEPSSSVVQLEKGNFRKVLGVADLFAVGYGDLGSSIYYALGITAMYALGATPLALLLAGLVFACTALTYAEMGAIYHESGGSASFARHSFNDLISFIAGWGLLLDYVVTISISAFAVGPYLGFFFPILKISSVQMGFSVALIVILFIVNSIGIRHSTRLSFILAGFTIVTQVIIVIIGCAYLLDIPKLFSHMQIGLQGVSYSPSWPEFWKGVAMAMVAYTGIESIAQLGSESKNPEKSLPKAIKIVVYILLFMYIGISSVALSALTPQDLSTTYLMDPIAGIVANLPVGSKILGPFVGVLAAILLFVAANAGLIGSSRLSFNMGEYFQLPRFFYTLHPRFQTPCVALFFFTVLSSILILLSRGEMAFLADLYNFGAMIAFFSAHVSLIVSRIKKPDLHRPYRVPFNLRFGNIQLPLTAIVGAFATLAVWILVVITKPDGRYLGIAWIGVGILMYFLYRKKHGLVTTGSLEVEKINIPDFNTLRLRKVLVPTRGGAQTETVKMACEMAKIHEASVQAIYVIEVPYSVPLDSEFKYKQEQAKNILKSAEAIAKEVGVEFESRVLISRSVAASILDILKEEGFDLVVLGSLKPSDSSVHKGLGPITDRILKEAPCRVWVWNTPFTLSTTLNSTENEEEE